MLKQLLRKKPIALPHADSKLQRSLTTLDLTLMGIGAIIGAGVFVLTGVAAATKAGPAIVLSYILAGIAAMLSALAYAEMASTVGGTGSAYNYAYVGFGEFFAWLIGWDLLLEYAMAVATVSIGWAGYVNDLLKSVHIYLPIAITESPFSGGTVNLLAAGILLLLTYFLCLAVKTSVRFNAIVVYIKLVTIFVFIVVAIPDFNSANWRPFLPFGWVGMAEGAALVFFAYIGFDALSTAVEEAIEPQRSIPIAIIVSLIVCTLIYMLVSGLLTGMVSYTTLNVPSPVATALLNVNHRIIAGLIAAGAIAGLTTVMLIMFYGLTRICYAMARDGLIPHALADIHPKSGTPRKTIIIMGCIMALIAGVAPIQHAAELVNIGTLAAFVIVSFGVIMLRITHPDLPRPFRLPCSPVIPMLAILFSLYLMFNLSLTTWLRFLVWMVIGLVIYFAYSQRHSHFRTPKK